MGSRTGAGSSERTHRGIIEAKRDSLHRYLWGKKGEESGASVSKQIAQVVPNTVELHPGCVQPHCPGSVLLSVDAFYVDRQRI